LLPNYHERARTCAGKGGVRVAQAGIRFARKPKNGMTFLRIVIPLYLFV
jgi:hypothetical protein